MTWKEKKELKVMKAGLNSRQVKIVDNLRNAQEWQLKAIEKIFESGYAEVIVFDKLESLNVDQICIVIKDSVIKDEKNGLYGYRDVIIKYFMEKKIDGSTLVLLIEQDKDKFILELKEFVNSKDHKLDNLLPQFLDDIFKLFGTN